MTAQQNRDDVRYGFGENWADYAAHINDDLLSKIQDDLLTLLEGVDLQNKTFMDIGSGSGVHSLAALKSGVKAVLAIDYDKHSVSTTQNVLDRYWQGHNYTVRHGDILNPAALGAQKFDIVYSWGVLHHTGDVWKAIEQAASFVADNGHFVIALYKKTPMCGFWAAEKRLYSLLPKILRYPLDGLYGGLQVLGLLATGRNPFKYIRNYAENRGMRWMIDIRDWLGGYPYESVVPDALINHMKARGFMLEKLVNEGPVIAKGIFGSGCAEFVFKKEVL
jgi:2-polyprenyl-3-methyl-5-hydroxy-6-metoxy-1,4-benzoquinol methylase